MSSNDQVDLPALAELHDLGDERFAVDDAARVVRLFTMSALVDELTARSMSAIRGWKLPSSGSR